MLGKGGIASPAAGACEEEGPAGTPSSAHGCAAPQPPPAVENRAGISERREAQTQHTASEHDSAELLKRARTWGPRLQER